MNDVLINHYNLKKRVIVNMKQDKNIGEALGYLWKKAEWIQPEGMLTIFHDKDCQCKYCEERKKAK